jgi:hypothetical protein
MVLDEAAKRRLNRLHRDSGVLLDMFADRLSEQRLERLRTFHFVGEWTLLVDGLCATLVKRAVPVTPSERAALAALLALFVNPQPHHRYLGDPERTLAALTIQQ